MNVKADAEITKDDIRAYLEEMENRKASEQRTTKKKKVKKKKTQIPVQENCNEFPEDDL